MVRFVFTAGCTAVEEQSAAAAVAPVEPEGELVGVVGQLRRLLAIVEHAAEPALAQRRHSVHRGRRVTGPSRRRREHEPFMHNADVVGQNAVNQHSRR